MDFSIFMRYNNNSAKGIKLNHLRKELLNYGEHTYFTRIKQKGT